MEKLQDHLEGLTLNILDVHIEDLPMRLHHHIIGVIGYFMQLLRMIA